MIGDDEVDDEEREESVPDDEKTGELTDRDYGWEDGDAADRRRDPLRK